MNLQSNYELRIERWALGRMAKACCMRPRALRPSYFQLSLSDTEPEDPVV